MTASETFTLSEAIRGQTAGRATWNTSFKEWTEVPKSMLETAVADIRKKKGLTLEPHNEITKKLADVQGELGLHGKSKTHYVKVAVPVPLVLTQFEVKINNLLPDIKNNVDEQKLFF